MRMVHVADVEVLMTRIDIQLPDVRQNCYYFGTVLMYEYIMVVPKFRLSRACSQLGIYKA